MKISNNLTTIRERIQRATAFFKRIDGVVLTTFNLNGEFLEGFALPTVLGVDAETIASRRAELHERLGQIPCTVYFDPTVKPQISGLYRYVARPVPIPNRFFHPKLTVITGEDEDGTSWVYLAVSSANLTLSGWGRNVESFGETWIHTRRQQPWSVLGGFLDWLEQHSPLEEEKNDFDAVTRIRAALNQMPDRRRFNNVAGKPWSASLYADLYISVVQSPQSFPEFLQESSRRKRSPEFLWAYSPYWSDVAQQVSNFGASQTILIPSWRADKKCLGISNEQASQIDTSNTEIRPNDLDRESRFWHMKAYWTQYSDLVRTAVGSCNFTRAGLDGDKNNVEAMLVFDADPEWLPNGVEYEEKQYLEEDVPEEDTPQPTPIAIVVGWDWQKDVWRWWLKPHGSQRNFKLSVPGLPPFAISEGTSGTSGEAPPIGAQYTVTYEVGRDVRTWKGQIVELNLDHSLRVYGRQLNANEILESWRSKAPALPGDRKKKGEPSDPDDETLDDEVLVAFDAVNLFDLYRSTRALRKRLIEYEGNPDIQRAYLVGRHNSAMALANMADQDVEVPVVRYLVLNEIREIMNSWENVLNPSLISNIEQKVARSRANVRQKMLEESNNEVKRVDNMLEWFERELSKLDLMRLHETF